MGATPVSAKSGNPLPKFFIGGNHRDAAPRGEQMSNLRNDRVVTESRRVNQAHAGDGRHSAGGALCDEDPLGKDSIDTGEIVLGEAEESGRDTPVQQSRNIVAEPLLGSPAIFPPAIWH